MRQAGGYVSARWRRAGCNLLCLRVFVDDEERLAKSALANLAPHFIAVPRAALGASLRKHTRRMACYKRRHGKVRGGKEHGRDAKPHVPVAFCISAGAGLRRWKGIIVTSRCSGKGLGYTHRQAQDSEPLAGRRCTYTILNVFQDT